MAKVSSNCPCSPNIAKHVTKLHYTFAVLSVKSDSDVLFCLQNNQGLILPPNALRRDCNGKCIEYIEGHALEVVVEV